MLDYKLLSRDKYICGLMLLSLLYLVESTEYDCSKIGLEAYVYIPTIPCFDVYQLWHSLSFIFKLWAYPNMVFIFVFIHFYSVFRCGVPVGIDVSDFSRTE